MNKLIQVDAIWYTMLLWCYVDDGTAAHYNEWWRTEHRWLRTMTMTSAMDVSCAKQADQRLPNPNDSPLKSPLSSQLSFKNNWHTGKRQLWKKTKNIDQRPNQCPFNQYMFKGGYLMSKEIVKVKDPLTLIFKNSESPFTFCSLRIHLPLYYGNTRPSVHDTPISGPQNSWQLDTPWNPKDS